MKKARPLFLSLLIGILAGAPTSAADDNRYDYCRLKAKEISGYAGPVPAEYEETSGALKGALKGASVGAGLAWLAGGNRDERKKAAKRAAGLGMLIGAIKKGEAEKERKRNALKRRNYEIELNACMASR